jgi:hypothetical protein
MTLVSKIPATTDWPPNASRGSANPSKQQLQGRLVGSSTEKPCIAAEGPVRARGSAWRPSRKVALARTPPAPPVCSPPYVSTAGAKSPSHRCVNKYRILKNIRITIPFVTSGFPRGMARPRNALVVSGPGLIMCVFACLRSERAVVGFFEPWIGLGSGFESGGSWSGSRSVVTG